MKCVSLRTKLTTEAPVNGGRNYKQNDRCSYVTKLSYMLESPVYPRLLVFRMFASNYAIL